MLTMVYTTLSYTVVYNLFFIVVYVYFCLLVGMCYVFLLLLLLTCFQLGWICHAFGGQG